MSVFRNKLSVDVHDVDFNGIARLSSLMRYIQSAAQSQLTESGYSYDELKSQKRAFILSRIKMEFTEPVRAYDELEAISFPCHSRGYSFLRCYKLERHGVTIGRAASVWALVDTDKHSLVRVNDIDLGLTTEEPLDLAVNHFALPSELTSVGTYTVNYGDTDQNRHMNNTRYPDMYSNFLPLEKKRIRSASISYLNEAPFGERLTVFRAESNGIFYFRTLREDGKVNTEAEIELTDVK
ncbi:MAG: hypothetical protein IKB38_09190 [Clostridia bacterium]|nr:hypothetical protein [Clostridia bacterium]